jgi:integrase
MATIKKRILKDGKVAYHVRIRLKGQPLQCATLPNISKAKEYIQRIEGSMREGRYFKNAEAKKHTLADLINRYIKDILPRKPSSERKQTAQLTWWKQQIGHSLLSDITPAFIVEQRDALARGFTNKGIMRSPATVVRYLAALSHAFTVAVKEWGWLEDSPMRKVSKPKEARGRIRFLDEDERSRLLQACKESDHSCIHIVVVLALSTGMRQGEIMHLTWRDVDFEEKKIVLHHTKNGERRVVPLAGHVLELLKNHFKMRHLDTFLLFPGKNPKKPADLRSAWEKALESAEIRDFRFHDLRHTFASYLAMNKATLTELRILLGHKSPSMTARYSHLSESYGAAIVNDMSEKIFGHGDQIAIPNVFQKSDLG